MFILQIINIIKVKEDDKLLREYKIILYGDITGDGKINSTDLLVLQRYILELDKLDDIYLKAGNINKNGKKTGSTISATPLNIIKIRQYPK